MADFDIGFKLASHVSSREMSRLGGLHPDAWEAIGDTLQTTERLADRAFRARQGAEQFVVYFEAYTRWDEEARWNILSKSALLSERERLPTRTLVFVLTPERYREQHGTFRLAAAGEATQQVWFREICLWREQPQPWWETVPGLMALYPLCSHQQPAEEAIVYAAQTIVAQVSEPVARGNLLATLAIFGNLSYPDMDVEHLIGVELMHESVFLEKIATRARLQGERAALLAVLSSRFGSEAADEFKEALASIADEAKLTELICLASKSRGIGSFRRALPPST